MTHSLMVLMLLHGARLDSRLDERGSLLLLEEQDRSRLDQHLIAQAKELLTLSAEGTSISLFHLEAGIAFHHTRANSFAEIDWPSIQRLYDALLDVHPSPVPGASRVPKPTSFPSGGAA